MKKIRLLTSLLALFVLAAGIYSCKKKDEGPEVIAGFSFAVDAADFRKVQFTSTAQNHKSLFWNFGDGQSSTEANPVHTFAAVGAYTVTLTAIGDDGQEDVASRIITIVDANAELTKLTGPVSKTWKLLRVVSNGRWPLEVGPITQDQVWWAMGRDNDEIALRPCIMNDEFIFYRDGKYEYKTNGDFWAEGGVFEPANLCQASTAANLTGPGGTDLSAFGDGQHEFVLTTGTNASLEVKGLGAFIGLPKIGTDTEVNTPQQSVKLDVLKISDGATDTLILESKWKFQNNTTGQDDAYWRIVLVHYDDPSQEPPIPGPKPVISFTTAVDGLTVSFTTTATNTDTYSWDFGDGATSSEQNPTHTYATSGIYQVKLTGGNANGTTVFQQELTVTNGAMTEAELIGGPWKIRQAPTSIFVGPGLGNSTWWSTPIEFLDGSTSGADDWSCITNDEFIFSAGGVYQYKTNGDARNDGYMGSPNGCIDDAAVAASGNGAAFGSATHSFTFTPAGGGQRPIITLTNGPTGAAFIGFYKGYYGGENSNSANPPNGGNTTNRYEVMSYLKVGSQEVLTLSVDISGAHDGSAAWSVVLVR